MKRNKTECYCINLRRATTALTKKYDSALEKTSLTINQFSIIKNISQFHNCDASMLADVMGIERTTLLRNIKPLVVKEIIMVSKKNNKKIFKLSKEGEILLDKAQNEWNKIQNEINDELGEKAKEFIELLNKIERI